MSLAVGKIAIGLSLSESFAEITLLHPTDKAAHQRKRWWLERKAWLDGLTGFLPEGAEEGTLVVSSLAQESCILRRTGKAVIWVTTEGFSDWLPWSQRDAAPQSVCPSIDLIHAHFVVAERMDASGMPIQNPVQEELLALAKQIKDKHAKHPVALAFLNANKNPTHEQFAKKIFQDEGLLVFCSSEMEENSASEGDRWDKLLAHSYSAQAQLEEKKLLLENAHFQNWKIDWLDKPLTLENSVYFGLERFLTPHRHWKLARALYNLPCSDALPLQPLSRFSMQDGIKPHFPLELRTYSPGPMIFGRALQPTWFDLLYWQNKLSPIEGVDELFSSKAALRIGEGFATIAKNVDARGRPDHEKLGEDLLQWSRFSFLSQCAQAGLLSGKKLLATGPLASSVMNWLGEDFFVVDAKAEFALSFRLAEMARALQS